MRSFPNISPFNELYNTHNIKVNIISAKWCDDNITLNIYLQYGLLGKMIIDKEECGCYTCP
jgi:hypothetical protein